MNSGSDKAMAALAVLLMAMPMGSAEGQGVERMKVLEFAPETMGAWYVVNDGVMGGRSSSDIRHLEGGVAVFQGNLSLENNGGFASVRTEVAQGTLAAASALVLTVRGDGKRYQLRLRMSSSFDGLAYAASFETTAGQWTEVELPLEEFRPTFRGYVPRNVRPLDPAQVRQIGLMLTDKQEGLFHLEIAGLDAIEESR